MAIHLAQLPRLRQVRDNQLKNCLLFSGRDTHYSLLKTHHPLNSITAAQVSDTTEAQ